MRKLMLWQGTVRFWQLANFGSRISVAPASMLMWVWDAICCVYEVAETFTLYLNFVVRGWSCRQLLCCVKVLCSLFSCL